MRVERGLRGLILLLLRHRGAVALGLIVLFVVDAAQIVIPGIVGRAVDALAAGDQASVRSAAVSILMLGIAVAAARFWWRWLLIGSARRIRRDLRADLARRLLLQPPEFFGRRKAGDLMAISGGDLDAISMACGFGVMALADAVFLVVLAAGAMSLVSWQLAVAAIVPVPIAVVAVHLIGRRVHTGHERFQEAGGAYAERLREGLVAVRALRAGAREPGFLAALEGDDRRLTAAGLSLARSAAPLDPVLSWCSGISVVLVLAVGAWLASHQSLAAGELVAFLAWLALLAWPVLAVGYAVNLIQRGSAALGRLDEVLAEAPGIADPAVPRNPVDDHLEFHAMEIRRGGMSVLSDISVAIAPGTILGVVGPTGCGKSTLAQSLVRLVDPAQGEVRLGGADLRSVALAEVRRRVALVAQDPAVFSGSVRDNLAFAAPDADDARIEQAARLACLHDEIAAMPQGYGTLLGERGLSLSGGQRQRLGLARAILADPRILVIDDALSAVDAVTTACILDQLRPWLATRSAVIAAHRLATVRGSDRILVLDAGRVAACATHDELLAAPGWYAEAWQRQHG